jgi:hypothetical protein
MALSLLPGVRNKLSGRHPSPAHTILLIMIGQCFKHSIPIMSSNNSDGFTILDKDWAGRPKLDRRARKRRAK